MKCQSHPLPPYEYSTTFLTGLSHILFRRLVQALKASAQTTECAPDRSRWRSFSSSPPLPWEDSSILTYTQRALVHISLKHTFSLEISPHDMCTGTLKNTSTASTSMGASFHFKRSFENKWSNLVRQYPDIFLEFWGTSFVMIAVTWLMTLSFLAVDLFRPRLAMRLKIQSEEKQPTRRQIWECFIVAGRNQMITCILLATWSFLIHKYTPFQSLYRVERSLPSILEFASGLLSSIFLREILAYYIHRGLHHPRLYTVIHSQHHRFTAPIALAAHYAHPVEHILHNLAPIALPCQIMRCHVLTFWAAMTVEIISGLVRHSGYALGGETKMHDIHHLKTNLYYGGNGLMDWVHGTNKERPRKRLTKQ